LVDFFDVDGFVDTICRLLDDRQERTRLGKAAREVAVSRYDLATSCLPQQLAWVNSLHDDRA
jgi:glycosyltransferase involved in cell wall biosynthesis